MEKTETIDYPRGVTFEQVWALLQETSKIHKENEEMIKRNDEQRKKDRQEWEERFEKDRKEWNKKMGELGNRFGELAEHLVAPGIEDRFNKLGYHFGKVAHGRIKIVEDGKIKTEVDLLLENDTTVMAVEIKAKPDIDDIGDHIKRLEILSDYQHRKNDNRKVEGAIAGAIFNAGTKQAAIKAGLYFIEQSGDTMKIDMPDGFVPQKW